MSIVVPVMARLVEVATAGIVSARSSFYTGGIRV
jgi:hypothetical protein